MAKKRRIKLYAGSGAYEWQLQTHDYISDIIKNKDSNTIRTIVVKSSRQIYGKSCFSKAELIRFSQSFRGSINAYVAPAWKLSNKMFKEIVTSARPLIASSNQTQGQIIFANGSIINFFSAEQGDNLRGFTVTGLLVVDEVSFIAKDVYDEYISPWTMVHDAYTIMASTPKYKNGVFYDCYNFGLDPDSISYKTFDWVKDFPPDPNNRILQEKKNTIPALKYRSEYLGEFIDGEGTVFGEFNHILYPIDLMPGIDREDRLYIGIDWGTGKGIDYTALSALNKKGEQVELVYFNEGSPEEQIKKLSNTLIDLKVDFGAVISKVYAESNSIGDVYLKLLQTAVKQYDIIITPFNTSEGSKREIIEDFQVAIEQNHIKLIEDREQRNQLTNFNAILNKNTNKLKYGANPGSHDDIVMANMLAYHALKGIGSNWGGLSAI